MFSSPLVCSSLRLHGFHCYYVRQRLSSRGCLSARTLLPLNSNPLTIFLVLKVFPFFPPDCTRHSSFIDIYLRSFSDLLTSSNCYLTHFCLQSSPLTTMKFSAALISLALAFTGVAARMEYRRSGPSATPVAPGAP